MDSIRTEKSHVPWIAGRSTRVFAMVLALGAALATPEERACSAGTWSGHSQPDFRQPYPPPPGSASPSAEAAAIPSSPDLDPLQVDDRTWGLPGHASPDLAGPGLPPSSPFSPYPATGEPALPGAAHAAGTPRAGRSVYVDLAPSLYDEGPWFWQVLPDGLIYQSYMAGAKESRMSAVWAHEAQEGWIWDVALGGRMPIFRYGTGGPTRIQGWQVDVEGAAFPRLDLEEEWDLLATDFRFGIPVTYGRGRYQMKIAYYHLSSHLGDELMLKQPHIPRINFTRDAFVWGHSFFVTESIRLYAEAAWAFYIDGGAKPWEFQFGVDYSPPDPTIGIRPVPFFAVNGHLREEVDFGGNLVVQAGWQWRGPTAHRFRMGFHYYVGQNEQYQFFDQYESKVGMGLWYDF